MINNETITVVIFVYNEENYINESLSAVLNQTVQVDEIIVVDDFSTDSTKDIVQQYSEVHLIPSKKKGMAYACETGLKLVDTDLFFICDGDDVIMNHYVENMYEFIQSERIKYGYSNFIMTDEELTPKRFVNKKKYYDKYEMLCDCHTSGYLFGYSEIIEYLIPFPENISFHDWYMSIILSQEYGRNYVNNTPLFRYRRHKDADSYNLHKDRQKYLSLLVRSGEFLKVMGAGLSEDLSERIIKTRIHFYDAMIDPTLSKTVRVLASELFTWREKLSVSLFPITLRLKYRW